MIKEEDIYTVGKFQKTHALKGELNMITDLDPEYFNEGNPIIVEYDGLYVPYYSTGIRKKGNTSYLVKIDGIDSEEQASEFVNKEIYILKKDAEEWIGEDLYSEDLEGYEIEDSATGESIGLIEKLDDTTENVLFIIKSADEDEIIIPANDDFIVEINDEIKKIRMVLPEGLVDLNKKEKDNGK